MTYSIYGVWEAEIAEANDKETGEDYIGYMRTKGTALDSATSYVADGSYQMTLVREDGKTDPDAVVFVVFRDIEGKIRQTQVTDKTMHYVNPRTL